MIAAARPPRVCRFATPDSPGSRRCRRQPEGRGAGCGQCAAVAPGAPSGPWSN